MRSRVRRTAIRGRASARRAIEIAGAEHISVIYRQQSFDEVAAWLGGGQPRGDARIIGVLLILVGGVLAARPLLALAGAGVEDGGGAADGPRAVALELPGRRGSAVPSWSSSAPPRSPAWEPPPCSR